jgi:hypothetical protein
VGQCGAGKGVFATANTTGTAQTFTVPSGCSNVFVQAWGAGGGGGHSATGGSGGYVSSTFAVTAGQVIDAWIAGGGVCTKTDKTDAGVADPSGGGLGWQNATTTANGGGARNGGGNNCAGGGGGLTTIAYAPSSYAIYVAAGGGATNTASNTDWGGAGGGTTGGFSAGSKSGGCSTSGGDGTFAGESAPGGTTGGGGAGDKGGATETGCPGAGGASNSTGGVTITTVEANNADDGQPANNTVFDYLTSCGSPGVGGPATDTEPAAGGSGCVVIRCE